MRQRSITLPALLAVALAACQQPANDSNIAIDNGVNAAGSAAADVDTLPPSETAPASGRVPANALNEAADAGSDLPLPPGTQEAGMIPDQYRGRWGMVAADCDQSRSDAKGTITIGERSMIFYESRAMLKERRPAIATSFSGLFAFTGEGQNWERVETLTRTADRLERRSAGPRGETSEALAYTRCKAKEA